MINVNEITAKLAQLPDAALQQYASMHKNDPYMVSLAISESNRRKAMRQAAQPQGMAPQGSVVDREISGIASLPAEMGMADGGIVAFSNGGQPSGYNRMMQEQYENKGSIYAPTFGLTRAERERLAAEGLTRGQQREIERRKAEERARISERGLFLETPQVRRRYEAEEAGVPSAPTPVPTPAVVIPASLYTQGDMGMEAPLAREPAAALTAEGQAPADSAASAPDIAALRAALSVPSGGASSIEDLIAAQRKIGKALSPEQEARREALRGEYSALEKSGLEGLREAQKEYESRLPKGQAYEEREKRLREAEEKEPEEKEQNLKMALVEAGLGMMAGTSPYAMVNIGQGAQQGLKSYKQGISELKKAAEKREDLLGVIEQARRAEAEGRAEKAAGFKAKEADLRTSIAKSQIEGIQKTYNLDRQEASNLVSVYGGLQQTAMTTSATLQAAFAKAMTGGRDDRIKNLDMLAKQVTASLKDFEAFERLNPEQMKEIERLRSMQKAITAEMANLTGFRAPAPAAQTTVPPGFRRVE
jgi:hypothetical protein